jgi:ABC-type thiamin/hydroxymethylpyrimidine transport system permease subunit
MDAKTPVPTRCLPKEQRGDAAKKTYFGLTSLVIGILSGLSLAANFIVANLNITSGTFSQLNNLTALFFCILTPLAFVLGVLGYTRKNDSKILSLIAIVLVTVPFLIMFAQLINYFIN